jgi:transcriptional regulator with XRE-family HTH domain
MDYVLGRKLRVARTEAGLSQQALAERLGITFQQVQKYEKGANRIAASRLVSIAAAVDRPISYFLDDAKEAASAARPAKSADAAGSAEHISMAALFASIDNSRVRRRVIELLRTIAESGSAPESRRAAPATKAKRKPGRVAKKAAGRARRG